VKTALIGGIGNVLLGDDGVGPYVVRVLESQYAFGENVEIVDLGTPALDLTHRIVGIDTVILVDCVAALESEGERAGAVVLYRKNDIVRRAPAQRLDPHSPALSECLLAADLLGAGPQNVLLVGVVGERFEPGCSLTPEVQQAAQEAGSAVLQELKERGFTFEERLSPGCPSIWWNEELTRPGWRATSQ